MFKRTGTAEASPQLRRQAARVMLRGLLPAFAAASLLATPAYAQFSDGWKFLEAVRKKEGDKVEQALSEPGSTIVNTRDVSSGETALHIVAARRDLTWLRYLIAHGANVNLRDSHGQTPLQVAANMNWTDGVAALVGAHANTDDPNDAGETPLITAVHQHNIEMMKLLLKAGADPDRNDNSGRSARDYAKLDDSSQVLSTIDQYVKPDAIKKTGPVYGPVL